MSSTPLNYEGLKAYLIEACKCTYEGKVFPPPYTSEDDMPDLYKSPKGVVFLVPLPNQDNGLYDDFIIDEVLLRNQLSPALYSIENEEATAESK